MTHHRLASLNAVPEGGNRAFEAGGQSVLICRSSAGVFAVANMCSHAFAYLEGGKVRGPYLFCPLHGARFDLRTGMPSGQLTKTPIATYPVELDGDTIVVELPQ